MNIFVAEVESVERLSKDLKLETEAKKNLEKENKKII